MPYGPIPPVPVERASMRMRWSSISFLHWAYDVDVVQAMLPAGLTVEPYDGAAWVGLVPFQMMVAPARGPELPWLSHFPETNVRTYVRADNGTTGIWFLSLDASRLPAVVAARSTWGLPYFWSSLRVRRNGESVSYECARKAPTPRARSLVEVHVGSDISIATAFDDYLTARFVLLARYARRLFSTRVEHPPWPLRRASVTRLGDGLVRAAGLPAPDTEPVVHFSEGVDVRVGVPHRVGYR